MIRKSRKKKSIFNAFSITLISLLAITFVLTSCFLQSRLRLGTDTIISQVPKQSSLPISVIGINEKSSLNATSLIYNSSSEQINTKPISLGTLKFTTYSYGGYSVQQSDTTQFYFPFPDNTNQDQTTGLDVTLPENATGNNETNSFNETNSYDNSSAVPVTDPISLENSKFITYSYGGYPIQQPDPTQFYFPFPDNTNQGQIAGSDALTSNTYLVQKIDFDATFTAPNISALGFDEMAIFATSNTLTYKGTEFGVRMDLRDGFVYGYIQETNGNYGDVNFLMLALMLNDGIIHHYTLIAHGLGVSFCIDGIDYGNLNFPSNNDYSNLAFSILAVVHRFTDYWDSNGDNMLAGNFSLNQL